MRKGQDKNKYDIDNKNKCSIMISKGIDTIP